MYEVVTISSTHPDCVGEGPLVYKPGKNRQFVQEKPFWCTNWVNNGTIAPQRDGGGWDVAKRNR